MTLNEFQGHHANQAYYKLGIMSPEYRHSGGSGCTLVCGQIPGLGTRGIGPRPRLKHLSFGSSTIVHLSVSLVNIVIRNLD